MALKIRLRPQGRNNLSTYRLVVTDIHCPSDGKYVELLGWYNPTLSGETLSIDADRLEYWLSQGAQLTDSAKSLVKKAAPAVMEAYREKQLAKKAKLRDARRKR